MDISWPATAEELTELQVRLAALEHPLWSPSGSVMRVGACFVCFPRPTVGPGSAGDEAWGAAALADNRRIRETVVVEGRARAPYRAGMLALREGPILEAAVRALSRRPEVLLVNATGRDHPRRAGLALHLGAVLDIPTIGVTHRSLVASGGEPPNERGTASPLTIDGEVVGCWLRTRAGARPVAVGPAWKTDLATATKVVMAAVRRARTPEPLRRARRAARRGRAGIDSGPPEDRDSE
jgi:deoxyribonuclease V